MAPTAPHATPPNEPRRGKRSGPERFWGGRKLALVACFVASMLVHYGVSPWTLLPSEAIDVKDQQGELAIPVDLIQDPTPEAPPPPPPPPPPADTPKPESTSGAGAHAEAGAPRHRDAGGGARDAGRDAEEDAESDAEISDGAPSDAERDAGGDDGGIDDGGAVPLTDAMIASAAEAGTVGTGERDPSAILGAAASGVKAGPQNVLVILNMEAIKTNPIGARLGPLLAAMPQWRDFFLATGIDPVRDGDWLMLFGPSLANTERDVAVVHFNVSDARAAKALETIARRDTGGGAFDAGVPGVKAWRGRADRAARVFMIPRPHLAAVSPPDFAHNTALSFSRPVTAKVAPGEAVRAQFKNPHGSVGAVPETISLLRLWVVPRPDGGADLFAEGDCTDAASAREASTALRRFVRGQNSLVVQAVTQGALNGVEFSADGSVVRGHLTISQEQLGALYDLAAAYLGINVPPPPANGAAPVVPAAPRAPQR